jgi:hypothetical protein
MPSITSMCSGFGASASFGVPPPVRVSPYARNEKRVTPADAASSGSGVAGGSMGLTVTHSGGGACCAAATAPAAATRARAVRNLMRGCYHRGVNCML